MTSTNPDRPNARKAQARRLAARTGMPYTAALRQVVRSAEPWQPQHWWVLTDDVRDWLSGESWRGIGYHDLYAWLDNEVSPTFECDWCGEPGDARENDYGKLNWPRFGILNWPRWLGCGFGRHLDVAPPAVVGVGRHSDLAPPRSGVSAGRAVCWLVRMAG